MLAPLLLAALICSSAAIRPEQRGKFMVVGNSSLPVASSVLSLDSSQVSSFLQGYRQAARAKGQLGISLWELQAEQGGHGKGQEILSRTAETCVCCALTGLTAAAFLFLAYRGREFKLYDTLEDDRNKDHQYVLDNAKLLLIFLVVYGHILYYAYVGESDDGRTWLSGSSSWMKWGFLAVRTFPVPMFCFVSGVLSQGPVSAQRVQRFMQFLIVPAFVWTVLVKGIVLGLLADPRPQVAVDAIRALVTLQSYDVRSYEWFLLTLAMWKGSIFLCWGHVQPLFMLISCIAISAGLGYVSLGFADNLFALLPFFAAGFAFPLDRMLKATVEVSYAASAIIGFFIFLWMMLQDTVFHEPLPDGYGSYYCCDAGSTFKDVSGLDLKLYWTRKVAKVMLDLGVVTGIILFLLPRRQLPLSWVGQYCLYPYLFHGVGLLWRERLVHAFPPPVITSLPGHMLVLLAHVPYALFIMVLFASSYWRLLFSWCFSPAWFGIFMIRQDEEKEGKEDSRA